MKTKIALFALTFSLVLAWSTGSFSQDMNYNDTVDDEKLRKKEQEAWKKNMADPTVSDPYYEKHIKKSWEKERKQKTKTVIEELKKEYGTDVFTKEVLDRGPKKKEKGSEAMMSPVSIDPFYEKNIKGNISTDPTDNFSRRELKKEVLEMIKNKVYGKEEEDKGQTASDYMSNTGSELDKAKSRQMEKERLLESAFDHLQNTEAIETKEAREKRLAEEKKKAEEKKAKEEKQEKEKKQ